MKSAETLRIRFWLFLIGCIGSRSLFTFLAYKSSCYWLQLLGGLALLPVIGFFYLVFIGRRDTGLEVFGDRIWWTRLRPIHMLMWGFFAYLAIVKCHPLSWVPLGVDTAFGLVSFLGHHYSEGNLRTMMGL